MRLPDTAHACRPWRVHELARDFRLEDVWRLPTPGGPFDFPRLVQLMAAFDPAQSSGVVRVLFALRRTAGDLLGWDRPQAGVGSSGPTLRDRLPADLRGGPSGPVPEHLPFSALYRTEDEWALEFVNRTVHGVLHLAWVPDRAGGHRGQMAVLARRNGLLGSLYMAAITPFRHAIVYPQMLRRIEREWQASPDGPTAGGRSMRG